MNERTVATVHSGLMSIVILTILCACTRSPSAGSGAAATQPETAVVTTAAQQPTASPTPTATPSGSPQPTAAPEKPTNDSGSTK